MTLLTWSDSSILTDASLFTEAFVDVVALLSHLFLSLLMAIKLYLFLCYAYYESPYSVTCALIRLDV